MTDKGTTFYIKVENDKITDIKRDRESLDIAEVNTDLKYFLNNLEKNIDDSCEANSENSDDEDKYDDAELDADLKSKIDDQFINPPLQTLENRIVNTVSFELQKAEAAAAEAKAKAERDSEAKAKTKEEDLETQIKEKVTTHLPS